MNFANRITRSPRPFEPERVAETAGLFESIAPETKEVLIGTAGSSPFLNGLIQRHASWLRPALSGAPETAFESVLSDVRQAELDVLATGLRLAKQRVALLAALSDLAGVWSLETVTASLTQFANLAVDRSIKACVANEIDRGKLPGMGEPDKSTAAGMSVLAMGKMGAGELNYSSDIDLICLFDEQRFEPEDYGVARASFIRATRKAMAMLSDLTGDGYVFRTDLRLRPDPSVTPVCLSMEAAERYYESVGRTWERAAHIKARTCAGDLKAGEAYLARLTPFIWRKHLDFAAIEDAHDMRLRIRDHKGFHGEVVLEGHNMKLGTGGIREIEFFAQTRQIIAGGRDPELRCRGTLEALKALANKDWVPRNVSDELSDDYRAAREIEHRLQMINDAQTHDLPKNEAGFERLAALMGKEVVALRSDILRRLNRVSEITEGFFAPGETVENDLSVSQQAEESVGRWLTYPALRSDRAVEIFSRLKPEILSRLQKAGKPEEALQQFDRFLKGLPSGVQVFSLFESNPQLIDLIVDIAATAPDLAAYLGRNAQVFDAVIGGDFFASWPDSEALKAQLMALLVSIDGYEAKLDGARRWFKEWHFRVGVHHLRGLIGADEAGAQYAALADAVLYNVWPVVADNFALKHGAMPGNGAVVVGMGSLGAERLTASSDLDLIVIYDPADIEISDGKRPLACRQYYARLTQALVTALSAPMAEGRLYEVDMRLRPSGRQGPVATSFQAFCSYQREQAWTWEHLALTRARIVTGAAELGARVEAFRKELLVEKRDWKAVFADVSEMRGRIAAAKSGSGIWEAKLGTGRMQDIELTAQTAALIAGSPAKKVAVQLATGVDTGWLSKDELAVLQRAYMLMSRLQSATRLLTGEVLDLEAAGLGGTAFVLRETGVENVEELQRELRRLSQMAAQVVETALGRGTQPA